MKYKYSHLVFVWLLLSCFSFESGSSAGNQTNMIQCNDKEREALLQFKQGMEDDYCGLLTSWVGQECCQWRGIRCSNHSGHVISLDVSGISYYDTWASSSQSDPDLDFDAYPYSICIIGKVSPSLAELKNLKYLDLSYNSFQGPIPNFIGSFVNLKYLNLSNSNFYGEVPHQLANLSSLTSLDLGSHQSMNKGLYVKTLRWLSNLTLLTNINLSLVNLSLARDWLPIVNNLPLIKFLQMDDCSLSMQMYSSLLEYTNSSTTLHSLSLHFSSFKDTRILEWVSNLTRLSSTFSYLDLSFNYLPGPIPSSLGNMHSLLHLDLSKNCFEGPIPETFSHLKHLVNLDLTRNNFQGSKWNPEVLGSLCSLQMLSLGRNNITNELSAIIQPLSQCVHRSLIFLDMHQNFLWGSLPDEMGTFSSLRGLHLNNNKLNGTISPSLGQLSMLESLFLNSNSLKGTISNHHLSNMSRLTELDLSDNTELVFDISANWVPPFQLYGINLGSCKLGPSFPNWLLTQKNVSFMNISNANISDTIPTFFWNSLSSDIMYLSMSGNMIHGNIPDVSHSFHNPLEIDLSSNLFHGPIPSFLRNASFLSLSDNNFSDCATFFRPVTKVVLSGLSLSNNKLTGELPSSWGYFDKLNSLHLDGNNFSGTLPNSMGMLTKLKALHLRQNNIFGKLPITLQKCTSLITLDLSHNSLTGALPNWFVNVSDKLVYLSLRNNDFRGDLPLSLFQIPTLQILDISMNRFSGFIPNCVRNLTAMIHSPDNPHIYITPGEEGDSFSYASGWIMWKREELSFKNTLGLVKAIDMSNNEFEGPIPDGISSLTGLQSLDLSRNRLNGSITPNIGQLTSLEFLDLSRNQLCGEIPSSLSAVSSLGTLDVSYNNLSGRIPHGTQLQGFSVSSYIGNPGLCGEPLPKCPGDSTTANPPKEVNSSQEDDNHDDDDIFPGLYISVVVGFIVGFWGVCGTLVIKRSWRLTFFQFFDDIKDRLHVFIVVKLARILQTRT